MQPVGNVVFNLFNSGPASANSRPRCVQSQGGDCSNRRVHEKKDSIPSMLREVSSNLAHKTSGWISSLSLGNVKPVLFASTLVNQFSPLFGQDTSEACLSSTATATATATAIRKVMAIANCSSETASKILEDVMKLEGLDSCSIFQILTLLGIGAVGGATFFVIGCGVACKGAPARATERYDFGTDAYLLAEMPRDCNNDGAGNDDLEEDLEEVGMTERDRMLLSAETRRSDESRASEVQKYLVQVHKEIPAIRERLCSGNDAHPPVETPRSNNDPRIAMAEKDPMLGKGNDNGRFPIPHGSSVIEFDDDTPWVLKPHSSTCG